MDLKKLEIVDKIIGRGVLLEHSTKLWAGFAIPGPRNRHIAIWGPKSSLGNFERAQAKLVSKDIQLVMQDKLRNGYSRKADLLYSTLATSFLPASSLNGVWQMAQLDDIISELSGTLQNPSGKFIEIKEVFTEDMTDVSVPWS